MNGQNVREEKSRKDGHEFFVRARKEAEISGVSEVLSFDESTVLLRTVCGEMTVEGKDLKIGTLDTERGKVSLTGKIDAVYYSMDQGEEKRGFFGKLFR